MDLEVVEEVDVVVVEVVQVAVVEVAVVDINKGTKEFNIKSRF